MADVPLVKQSVLTTKGDLFVFDGTDLVRLPVGSDDTVLIADAAEAAGLRWGAGGGGSGAMALLATAEVVGAAAADITFSGITGAYKDLLVMGQLRSDRAATTDSIRMQVGNGAADTGANYSYATHGIDIGAVVGADEAAAGASSIYCGGRFGLAGDTLAAGVFSYFEARIFDYADTDMFRLVRSESGQGYNVGQQGAGIGRWHNAAAAIDTVKLFPGTGPNFVIGSKLRLYGIG